MDTIKGYGGDDVTGEDMERIRQDLKKTQTEVQDDAPIIPAGEHPQPRPPSFGKGPGHK